MHAVKFVFSRLLCYLFMGQVTWTTLHFLSLYKALIVTLEHTIRSYAFFESFLPPLECSPYLRVLCACGFKNTPLWIQGLKRLVLWIQILALLEEQDLWIQAMFFVILSLRMCHYSRPLTISRICSKLVAIFALIGSRPFFMVNTQGTRLTTTMNKNLVKFGQIRG